MKPPRLTCWPAHIILQFAPAGLESALGPSVRRQKAALFRTSSQEELERKVEELAEEVRGLRAQVQGEPAAYSRRGRREYRSRATWLGIPLVHVCMGPDPQTGRPGVAKGIIAIGDVAIGVLALGGAAFGGIALGGFGFGLVTMAGLGVGLLAAMAGLAIGGIAIGGVAVGGVALGGLAIGYVAIGGAAAGVYALGGEFSSMKPFQQCLSDPAIPDFLKSIISWVYEQR